MKSVVICLICVISVPSYVQNGFHPPNPGISSINPRLSDKNLKIFAQNSCYFIFPPYLCIDSASESVPTSGIIEILTSILRRLFHFENLANF